MLKQKFLVQFGTNISLKILAMISGIVVARVAGPEVVGTIAYAMAYVGIFSFVIAIFSTGHIKLISEGRDLGKCMAVFTRLQLISYVVFFLLVIGWFCIQKYILNYKFESVLQQQVIIVILFATIFSRLVNFSNTSYTAQIKQAKANLPNFIRGIVYQFGRIVVVLLGFKALGLAGWNLIVAIVLLPFAYTLFKQLPLGNYDKTLAKQYFKYALPILLIVILISIIGNLGSLLLEKYSNTTELGYYSIAYSLGGIILLVGASLGTLFFPLFSSLIQNDNWVGVNQKIGLFETFLANFLFPIVCLVVLISEPLIIMVLGERYIHSVIPFAILISASYFMLVSMPYGNIMSGMGKFYIELWVTIVRFILYLITIILLLSPKYFGLGAIGLAITTLFMNVFEGFSYFLIAKKLGQINIGYMNIVRHFLIICISIGFYFLNPIFNNFTQFWWIIFIPLYLIVIFVVLRLTGLLTREQINTIVELFNIKKTFSYIKNEFNEK